MEIKEISLWLGNHALYAEGKLEGEWLRLPMGQEALEQAISNISKGGKDELFIADREAPDDLHFLLEAIEEYTDPRQVNALVRLCGTLNLDFEAVNAYIEVMSSTSLREMGNVLMQADEIPFYHYCFQGMESCSFTTPEEMYGYTVTEQTGLQKKIEEIGLEMYVDYGAMGRDVSLSGNVNLGEGGYLDCTATANIQLDAYGWADIYKAAGLECPAFGCSKDIDRHEQQMTGGPKPTGEERPNPAESSKAPEKKLKTRRNSGRGR